MHGGHRGGARPELPHHRFGHGLWNIFERLAFLAMLGRAQGQGQQQGPASQGTGGSSGSAAGPLTAEQAAMLRQGQSNPNPAAQNTTGQAPAGQEPRLGQQQSQIAPTLAPAEAARQRLGSIPPPEYGQSQSLGA
jgi:hypothetical protein